MIIKDKFLREYYEFCLSLIKQNSVKDETTPIFFNSIREDGNEYRVTLRDKLDYSVFLKLKDKVKEYNGCYMYGKGFCFQWELDAYEFKQLGEI